MNSTRGRPRALNDAQVEEILAWHKCRKSLVQVAREHGVSTETIRNLIERGGVYKQPSPELRAAARQSRREVVKSWDRPLGLRKRRRPSPVAECATD